MKRIKSKDSYSLLLIKTALIAVSLSCSIFVGFAGTVKTGLEMLFLLPLAFAIGCFFSQKAIIYAKDSFGLIILYGLIVLRYLVTPVLITLSGNLVPNLSLSADGLLFAIAIMIIELFIVIISINIIWKPVDPYQQQSKEKKGIKLSWTGVLICLLLVALIIYRGTLPNVLEHLSFGKNYAFSNMDLKTYDMYALMTLKNFLFLLIVSWLSRKYYHTKIILGKRIYFFLAIAIAVTNSVIYDASHRATMVISALATLSVLLFFFGHKIQKLVPIIFIAVVIFVWSLFSYGTLGVRDGESLLDRNDYISDLSYVAELYSNGVSTEAHAYDMYDTITMQISPETYISELIKSIQVFTLPGFWVVGKVVESTPSIQKLFNNTLLGEAYILPNAGLAIYSGTKNLGWLIDTAFHYLIVVGIYYFYRKKQLSPDVSGNYLNSYCEMICGLTLINNIMIAISLLTAWPLLLFVLIKLNNSISVKFTK